MYSSLGSIISPFFKLVCIFGATVRNDTKISGFRSSDLRGDSAGCAATLQPLEWDRGQTKGPLASRVSAPSIVESRHPIAVSVMTKKNTHDDDAVTPLGRSTPRERRGCSSDGNGNGSPPLLTSPCYGASLLDASERAASSSSDTWGTSGAQRLSKDGENKVERTSSKMRLAVRMISMRSCSCLCAQT